MKVHELISELIHMDGYANVKLIVVESRGRITKEKIELEIAEVKSVNEARHGVEIIGED